MCLLHRYDLFDGLFERLGVVRTARMTIADAYKPLLKPNAYRVNGNARKWGMCGK